VEDPLDIADDENPKVKKIANKIMDYTLDNTKPSKEKLKVRKPKIRHRVIMPGDSKRNREDLIKSELEYFDVSESEEENSKAQKKKMKIDLWLEGEILKMMMMIQKKFHRIIIY
jgi:hypothetical protein